MTNYQEQLTLMQHDLESGLEAMGEALANTGGDNTGTYQYKLIIKKNLIWIHVVT